MELRSALKSMDFRTFKKARQLVSKNKRRFQEYDFDLDLSYIEPNIIAMGYPSTGLEAVYRNPLRQVQRFFTERHLGHYKVYNLCSERDYDLKEHFPIVERWPFDDHTPCPMDMMVRLVESIVEYLQCNDKNVVAVHCKAGKGRTGMVISGLLLRLGRYSTAAEALRAFAERRTLNGEGVTIPSQRRYVQYYERLLRRGVFGGPLKPPTRLESNLVIMPTPVFELTGIRFSTVPVVNQMPGSSKCTPYFKVFVNEPDPTSGLRSWNQRRIFSYRDKISEIGEDLKAYELSRRYLYLDCSQFHVKVSGEVGLRFYATRHMGKGEKICHVWFHTGFIRGGHRVVQFDRGRIDVVNKDKKCRRFSADFAIQVFLRNVPDSSASISEVDNFADNWDDQARGSFFNLATCGTFWQDDGYQSGSAHFPLSRGCSKESLSDSEDESDDEDLEELVSNRRPRRRATEPKPEREIDVDSFEATRTRSRTEAFHRVCTLPVRTTTISKAQTFAMQTVSKAEAAAPSSSDASEECSSDCSEV